MIRLYLWLQSHLRGTIESDRGQSTAEYALVLLGAAAIALLLVAWVTISLWR